MEGEIIKLVESYLKSLYKQANLTKKRTEMKESLGNIEKEIVDLQEELEMHNNNIKSLQEKFESCEIDNKRSLEKIDKLKHLMNNTLIQCFEEEKQIEYAQGRHLTKIIEILASQSEYLPDHDSDSSNVPNSPDDQNSMQLGYLASSLNDTNAISDNATFLVDRIDDEPMNDQNRFEDEPINDHSAVDDEPTNDQSRINNELATDNELISHRFGINDESINNQNGLHLPDHDSDSLNVPNSADDQNSMQLGYLASSLNDTNAISDNATFLVDRIDDEPINDQNRFEDEPVNDHSTVDDEPTNDQSGIYNELATNNELISHPFGTNDESINYQNGLHLPFKHSQNQEKPLNLANVGNCVEEVETRITDIHGFRMKQEYEQARLPTDSNENVIDHISSNPNFKPNASAHENHVIVEVESRSAALGNPQALSQAYFQSLRIKPEPAPMPKNIQFVDLTQDDDDDDGYNGSRSNVRKLTTAGRVITDSNKFSTPFQYECAIDESSVVTPVTSSEHSSIYPARQNPLTPLQPSLQEDFSRKQECERACSSNSVLLDYATPNPTPTNSLLPLKKRDRIPIIDYKVDNSDGFSTPMIPFRINEVFSLATPNERSNTSYNTENGDRPSSKRKEMHLARNEEEIFEKRHESFSPLPSTSQDLDLSPMDCVSYSVMNKNNKDRRETIADGNSGAASSYQSSSNFTEEPNHSLNENMGKIMEKDPPMEKKIIFICDICSATFKSLLSLDEHAEKKHLGDPKMFKCNICLFQNLRKSALEEHEHEVHGSEINFERSPFQEPNATLEENENIPNLKARVPSLPIKLLDLESFAEPSLSRNRGGTRNSCKFCDERVNRKDMSDHLHKKHAKNREVLRCCRCKFWAPNRRIMNNHVKKNHDGCEKSKIKSYVRGG